MNFAISASLLLVASAGAQPVAEGDNELKNVEVRDLFFDSVEDNGYPILSIHNPTDRFFNYGDMKIEIETEQGTTETVPLGDLITFFSYEYDVRYENEIGPRGYIPIGRGGYETGNYGSPKIAAAVEGLGNSTKSIKLYLYNDLKDVLTFKSSEPPEALTQLIRKSPVCRGTIDGESSREEWLTVPTTWKREPTPCPVISKDPLQLTKIRELKTAVYDAEKLLRSSEKQLKEFVDEGLDLFISEINEGYGNNKYIEIYNPTQTSKSLHGVRLFLSRNGKPTEMFKDLVRGVVTYGTNEWSAPDELGEPIKGRVPSRGVFTICSVGFDGPRERCDKFDDDITSFNGNDSLLLVQSRLNREEDQYRVEVLDYFGDAGSASPFTVCGVAEASKNNLLRRRTTICKGNNEKRASFGTSTKDCEWMVGEATDYQITKPSYGVGIGNHENLCGIAIADNVGLDGH